MKENQNQMDYNIWSATEYKNNLEDIYSIQDTIKANPSTKWSSIGEQSLHLTATTNSYQAVLIKQISMNNNISITAELDILHKKGGNNQLRITQADNTYTDVNIPVSANPQHISLSKQITVEGTVKIFFIMRDNSDEAYIDNISLTAS